KAKADLRLDSRAALLQGTDNGPAVVAGAPDKGLLMKAIRYQDPEVRMPPRAKLPDSVIANFAEWIRQGAPWPEDKKGPLAAKLSDFNLAERAKHWSLQPLTHPPLPKVK